MRLHDYANRSDGRAVELKGSRICMVHNVYSYTTRVLCTTYIFWRIIYIYTLVAVSRWKIFILFSQKSRSAGPRGEVNPIRSRPTDVLCNNYYTSGVPPPPPSRVPALLCPRFSGSSPSVITRRNFPPPDSPRLPRHSRPLVVALRPPPRCLWLFNRPSRL